MKISSLKQIKIHTQNVSVITNHIFVLLDKLRNEYVTLHKGLSIRLGSHHSTETACWG